MGVARMWGLARTPAMTIITPCDTRPHAYVFVSPGTEAVPSTLTSSRRSTKKMSAPTAYLSTSTGENAPESQLHASDDHPLSDWVKLYLGKRDGAHVLSYNQFTQLMKGLQGERLRQAFKYFDTNQDGFITPEQFKKIILVSSLVLHVRRHDAEAWAV